MKTLRNIMQFIEESAPWFLGWGLFFAFLLSLN